MGPFTLLTLLPGFEYWANPSNREEGFITWQTDGKPSVTMYASAVDADPVVNISRRLIPEEPMVRITSQTSTSAKLRLSFALGSGVELGNVA